MCTPKFSLNATHPVIIRACEMSSALCDITLGARLRRYRHLARALVAARSSVATADAAPGHASGTHQLTQPRPLTGGFPTRHNDTRE